MRSFLLSMVNVKEIEVFQKISPPEFPADNAASLPIQRVSLTSAQVSLQVLRTPGHRPGVGCLSAREE